MNTYAQVLVLHRNYRNPQPSPGDKQQCHAIETPKKIVIFPTNQ
ncbi:hypothetical protein BH09CHL1_BH09CHL1_33090 [soil metagenome]